MYLKPKDDTVLLRDPRSRVALPSYGANVSNSTFWIRRMNEGDAVLTTREEIEEGRAKAKAAHDVELKAKQEADVKAAEAKAKADGEARDAELRKAAKAKEAKAAKAAKAKADKSGSSSK